MRERNDPRRSQLLAVIESAYKLALPIEDWLDDVVLNVSRALDGDARGMGLVFDATRPDWVELSHVHSSGFPDWLKPAFEQRVDIPPADQTALVALYRHGAFGSVSDMLDRYTPPLGAAFRNCGVEQLSGLIATDPTFRGCAIGVATRTRAYSPRVHLRWRKISAHLAAGLRLRRTLDSLRPHRSDEDNAEAVLATDGKVEHATGPARAAEARTALQEALVRIDAARGEPIDRSLDLWAGLVAGRWSLVEHYERADRRYFLAYRNDPDLARVRALTARELQVCSYAALGYSNKLIGYTLGLATPTVARYLERARRKLGGRAFAEVIHALQLGPPENPGSEEDPPFEC